MIALHVRYVGKNSPLLFDDYSSSARYPELLAQLTGARITNAMGGDTAIYQLTDVTIFGVW